MVNFNDIKVTNTGTDAVANYAMKEIIKGTSLKRYLQVTVGYIPTGMKCVDRTPEGFEILEKSNKYITSFENYVTDVLRSKKWFNIAKIKNSEPKRYKDYHYNEENQLLDKWLRYEYISPDYTVVCRIFDVRTSHGSESVITFQFTGEPISIPDEYYEKPTKKQYDFFGNVIEPIDTETARIKSNDYWDAYMEHKKFTLDFNIAFNSEIQIIMAKYKNDWDKIRSEQDKIEKQLRSRYRLASEEYQQIADREKELRQYLIHHTPRGAIQSVLKSHQLQHPCADLCRLFRKSYGLKGYHDDVTKKSWYDNSY